jgi:hypothetical protein
MNREDETLQAVYALQRKTREDIAQIVERLRHNEDEYLRALRHWRGHTPEPGQWTEETFTEYRKRNATAQEELLAQLWEAIATYLHRGQETQR